LKGMGLDGDGWGWWMSAISLPVKQQKTLHTCLSHRVCSPVQEKRPDPLP
jgi:hypothetical protein